MNNRKRTAKRIKGKDITFYIVLLVLFLVSSFLFSNIAYSKENEKNLELERYYDGLENEMLKNVRAYLSENGFRNSGVSLTRVVDSDNYRTYQLTVHHDHIDRMEDKEREELKAKLCAFGFEDTFSTFQCDFL